MRPRALKRIILGWILLIVIVALLGKVSIAASDAGRTAADFLSIGLGARAAGMGGSFTAASEGAIASYWNPAGLSSLEGGQAVLGHFAWFQDITLEHGALAYQVSDNAAVAASVTFLNYGQIDRYDANGVTGEITAYDLCGALSVGIRAGYNVSLGLSGKFVNQKLDDLNGSTFGVDVGVRYATERLALAAVVANVGPDIGFDNVRERLPTTLRLGVAAYPVGRSLMTSFEADKHLYGGVILRNGFEFAFGEQYFLRTGYSYFPGHEQRAFGTGVSVGAGLKLAWGEIDYAFTPAEHYSSETLHRLSLSIKFGQN